MGNRNMRRSVNNFGILQLDLTLELYIYVFQMRQTVYTKLAILQWYYSMLFV